MESTADQSELFPVLSSTVKAKSWFVQWIEATEKHGPLMTPAMCATTAALSRQRIHQLLEAGRIAFVNVAGHRMIPVASLDLFLSESRPSGRPLRPGFSEKFNALVTELRVERIKDSQK
jgi:hypothetical protein